jgi:hypothetical protein
LVLPALKPNSSQSLRAQYGSWASPALTNGWVPHARSQIRTLPLPFKQSQAIPPRPRSNPSYAGRSARHGRAARPHWVAPPQGERTRRQAPAYRRLRRAAAPRPGLPAARRGAHRVHGQGGCRQPPQREDEGQEQDGLQGRFHFFSPISRLRLPSVDSISSAPVTHQ